MVALHAAPRRVDTGAFLDPAAAPSAEEIVSATGPAAMLWDELTTSLRDDFGAQAAFRWDGARHGWSYPVYRAGRPLVTLTPLVGGLAAMVVLGPAALDGAASLPLGERMRETLARAPQYPDGRWLFVQVHDEEDVRDILALASLKLPPTIRARVRDRLGLSVEEAVPTLSG